MGAGARLAPGPGGLDRRGRGDRRGRQPVVHARRGRRRQGSADRRPHRLGAERRLARRVIERRRRGRGAAANRRGRAAACACAARQLGRRGGRALRPLALRVIGGRRVDARPGRAREADRPRRRVAARRDRPLRRRSIVRSTRARSSRTRAPTSSSTSSKGRCSSRWTFRSGSCSGRSVSNVRA